MSNKETNTEMKNTEITLEDIFNDEMFTEMVKEDEKTLKESGWSRKDVNEMAKFVIKNSKK